LAIKKLSEIFYKAGGFKLSEIIGTSEIELDGGAIARVRETNLGYLLSEIIRQKAGADFAMFNGGALRSSLAKGNIKYRDILEIMPFANNITLFKLTAADIKELLDYALSIPAGQGGKPHFSGIKIKIAPDNKKEIYIQGVLLDNNKSYLFATSNYLADGGDGYSMLKNKIATETGIQVLDTVIDYIKSTGKIKNFEFSPAVEISDF